ncbi:hypothetical protein GS399_11155 [Pedobacter sp. HMF7647]|uniref:Uncharacterized protein n=1 Tax=Hufsiella arboris TaxID=2695275 RepID=A0A7K1YBR6_9SPHI|nr:hypothetical protein [Hufsiella arboris]MXV51529.1 hypothetical protein [Hufsiella arboris]
MKDSFNKYYRVFKNDTAITEVSTNDFKPLMREQVNADQLNEPNSSSLSSRAYSLPADKAMFYGYKTRKQAVEMARKGALSYMNMLAGLAAEGLKMLKQYRIDHYEDLNFNLVKVNNQG